MKASYRLTRLSEDAADESHFDDFDVPQSLNNFAPPAGPFLVSSVEGATGYVVIRVPVGWTGELHRSPHRQILFCLGGVLKVTASDGDIRMIETGNAWLMSDTRGKGHKSEVVSDTPFDAVNIFAKNSD